MQEITGLGNGGGGGSSSAPRVSNGRGGDRVVRFQLSPSSAMVIQKGDITRWFVDSSSDAIVNPANERMLGGGGADGAIHDAAGPELQAACYNVPEVRRGVRCPTGEARITPGFRLPASHVIHTVGPIYDADANPEASLRSAYRSSLRLAKQKNIQYIAFPAISCGVYRASPETYRASLELIAGVVRTNPTEKADAVVHWYPCDEAATIAISTVREFANDFKEVHFVLFSDDIYKVWLDKANKCFKSSGFRCLTICSIS